MYIRREVADQATREMNQIDVDANPCMCVVQVNWCASSWLSQPAAATVEKHQQIPNHNLVQLSLIPFFSLKLVPRTIAQSLEAMALVTYLSWPNVLYGAILAVSINLLYRGYVVRSRVARLRRAGLVRR